MPKISKNFNRSEFACKCGCGFDTVDVSTLRVLEGVREFFNRPVIPTSGCRCEAHNAKEGGSKDSLHLQGRAADIVVSGIKASEVYDYLNDLYPNSLGLGNYETFTHVDTRTDAPARF